MKNIFKTILERLKNVPDINYVDEDKGQLEVDMRPSVNYPCALFTIEVINAENIAKNVQLCDAQINVRIAFDYSGNTSSATSNAHIDKSLAYYDTVESVWKAMQGFETQQFNALENINQRTELRPDKIKVVSMPFRTRFKRNKA